MAEYGCVCMQYSAVGGNMHKSICKLPVHKKQKEDEEKTLDHCSSERVSTGAEHIHGVRVSR